MGANESARGSCLCGAVRYEVRGQLRDVVACHCGQCRKQTGHFYAATDCLNEDLTIHDPDGQLRWYAASDFAQRGFCGTCGSALFWRRDGAANTSVLAGSLDDDGGIRMERHIFVGDKGEYYEIADGLPQHAGGDTDGPPRPRR